MRRNFEKKVGILSIDIDGNDYWIWKEINTIDPSIVIIEYNARLGKDKTYVVPYEKNFEKSKKNHSMIYYGASIQALVKLLRKKDMHLFAIKQATMLCKKRIIK